jgi:hypothetical protein
MVVNRDRAIGKEEREKGKEIKTDKIKNNTLLLNYTTQ